MSKSGFFQEQGQLYDKFGRKVTPRQVLGLEDLFSPDLPKNKVIMEAATQAGLIPGTPAKQTTPMQERPTEAQFGKPKNAFNRGAVDTSQDGPPKTPEQSKQGLLDYLDKYPDDIQDVYSDFDGKAPKWLDDLYNSWKEKNPQGRPPLMSKSAGRPPAIKFGKGRPSPLQITKLDLPTSKELIPIAGILNTIIDRERQR